MTEQTSPPPSGSAAGADTKDSRCEPASVAPPWWLRPGVWVTAGLLLILALYARTATFDFVSDDQTIPNNPWLQSWKTIPDIFTHDLFASVGGIRSTYYRPMSALWVLIVYRLTGGSPLWFHCSAIALQLCLFYLAFLLGRKLFRDQRLAALAALCFALHPGKVESVAWVGSSACDGLGAILFFATLLLYVEWQEHGGALALAGSLICFAGAMFTKETLGIGIALIAIYEWSHGDPCRRMLKTLTVVAPYAAIAAGYLLVRRMVLGKPSPMAIRPALGIAAAWNAPAVCGWYLKHLLLPIPRGFMYDMIPVAGASWRAFGFLLLGLLVILAVGAWMVFRRRSANGILLYAWFVLALAPYIAFAPMVQLHDRYLHLASYPLCVLVAYLILRLGKTPYGAQAAFAIGVIVVGLCAADTWHESGFWRNDLSLWSRAVQTAPRAVEPRMRLASLYSGDADGMRSLQVLDQGLALNPNSPGLWRARGLFLLQRRQYPAARVAFQKVIEVSALYDLRKFPDVLDAKAWAAFHLGLLDIAAKDYTSAEPWLRTALDLLPNVPRFHQALAAALNGEGRADEAREQNAIAVELDANGAR